MSRLAESIKILSQNLDRLMKAQGLKNSWLASSLNCSREMVGQWRKGISYPTIKYLPKIASILKCIPEELTKPLYISNIIKMMLKYELTVETLALHLDIDQDVIIGWMEAFEEDYTKIINKDHLEKIIQFFECQEKDILESISESLSINEWAKREDIPLTRAKDLFSLGILEGAIQTDFCIMVPKKIRVPEDSKKIVTLVKKRPHYNKFDWKNFSFNFSRIMDEEGISNIDLANLLDVVPPTISHWRSGIRFPSEKKLNEIVKIFNHNVEEFFDKEKELV